MSLVATAAELLSRRLGLSPELLGNTVIERALDAVFAEVPSEDRESRAARILEDEGQEWRRLVDEVIVPETWFFRHYKSFQFLASYVKERWRPVHPTGLFRVFCIPCASGEEPYSVAMTLLDAGLDASRIRIDAADVSERLLARARPAVYGKSSFREKFRQFREEYFVNCEEGWRVREEVVRLVRFEKVNLLDLSSVRQPVPYDAIFCRNVLIYLDEHTRHEVVSRLRELLAEKGLLFTGPSELRHFCEAGYVPVDYPQSFACRTGELTPDRAAGCSPTETVTTVKVQRATVIGRVAPPDANRYMRACPAPGLPPGFEQAEQLANRGDLDAATAVCNRLLEGSAQNPEVYALLGVIHESSGKVESAEEFFCKALYLAPDHYESLLHMSLLCERRGDVDGARLYRARAGRALGRQEGKQILKGL